MDDLYQSITGNGVFLDLSDRTRLRFEGADRQRYLQGQVSNDVREARDGRTVYCAVMTSKGKMAGDGFIRDLGNAYGFDAEANVREAINARFERYIIADDVTLTDETDSTAQFHVIAPQSQLSNLPGSAWTATRFGLIGLDLFVPRADADNVRATLASRFRELTPQECEQLRIEQGIPRYGQDMAEDTIPNEAGLEARAISYHKGCYIGQEVISRIKSVGHVNWSWSGLILDNPTAPSLPLKLQEGGKDVGEITSVLDSPGLKKVIALGYVKRDYAAPGTVLTSGDLRVTVTPLPFVPVTMS